jgi:SAM-dependent MidA family methyltransferase
MKSSIELYLTDKINNQGEISFSEFMEISLYHKDYGYYTSKKQIFGKNGDFITSPINSSLFGESISNEFINLKSNIDKDLSIIEMGGGDASLAIDLLKNLKTKNCLPGKYILLEISDSLIKLQKDNIKKSIPDLYYLFEWKNSLKGLSIDGLIIANEFFDALPTERFRVIDDNVECLFIGIDGDSYKYIWNSAPSNFIKELELAKNNHEIYFKNNYISEINLHYKKWLKSLDKVLKSGVIFLIDYGYNSKEYFLEDRNEGTLVCVHNHQPNFEPMVNIGEQDLSSFVNFSHLSNICLSTKLDVAGYFIQSNFLINLGILDLFQSKKMSENEKLDELNRLKNILLPNTMGEIFKVLIMEKNIDIPLLSTKEFNHMHKL